MIDYHEDPKAFAGVYPKSPNRDSLQIGLIFRLRYGFNVQSVTPKSVFLDDTSKQISVLPRKKTKRKEKISV